MQAELALRAVSHLTIAVLIIALLLVLLAALRKESHGEEPFRGTVPFGLLIIGLCTFTALMTACFQGKRIIVPERLLEHIDTVSSQELVLSSNARRSTGGNSD
jgi:hypothetical protein